MFDIDIDISDVVEDLNLMLSESRDLSTQILDRVVSEYQMRLETLVGQELNQTKSEYLRAIEIDRKDEFSAIIRLTSRISRLALMLEDGADPFDIKEGLEKSKKRKVSLAGNWYIDVPFRFATSKALAASPVFTGGVAPSGVIRAAKKAAGAAVPVAGLPKKNQEAKIREAITRKIDNVFYSVPKYEHKVSVYAGIRRRETGTSKKRSGTYNTFRRVSANSDQNSWIHKGFEAKKFMDRTLASLEPEIDSIVDFVINNYLENR